MKKNQINKIIVDVLVGLSIGVMLSMILEDVRLGITIGVLLSLGFGLFLLNFDTK